MDKLFLYSILDFVYFNYIQVYIQVINATLLKNSIPLSGEKIRLLFGFYKQKGWNIYCHQNHHTAPISKMWYHIYFFAGNLQEAGFEPEQSCIRDIRMLLITNLLNFSFYYIFKKLRFI